MNYRKIYGSLIQKAKKENRKKNEITYYERHHIIPMFMFANNPRNKTGLNVGHLEGDPNDKRNIVLLTAREHFIAHILLYKMLTHTRYHYSSGASLMLFFNVSKSNHKRVSQGNFYNISKRYEKYRLEGIKCISKLRMGTFPCVDVVTGEMMGSFPKDHPKVLSGEYVHHSTGKHKYYNPRTGEKIWCSTKDERVASGNFLPIIADQSGMENGNALPELTEDLAFKIAIEVYNEQKNNREIISSIGHLHNRNFLKHVDEKLRVLFPNRKSFSVVFLKRLGCSHAGQKIKMKPLAQVLSEKLNLPIIACNDKIKFPRENQC
jgi:hypothetical protein